MFERKHQELAPLSLFIRRMAFYGLISGIPVVFALCVGLCGYHWIAGFGWVDSFLETCMILGGMGPVNPLTSNSAKLFAAGYALFSGLVFIGAIGIVITPVIHRVLHIFHLGEMDQV